MSQNLFSLAQIVTEITRKPRYLPRVGIDFEWSNKSYTHNFFRFLETVFGRRIGVRAEMTSWTDGEDVWYFCHTLESVIAFTETYIRGLFSKLQFQPIRVYRLAPVGFTSIPYLFAIAFDVASSADGGIATTNTYSHTCTGSNLTLITMADGAQVPTPTITATYATVGMTEQVTQAPTGNNRISTFTLASPSTGANNVVTTTSASARNFGGSISLTGTAASPVGANNTANATSATPSVSVTTTQANSWLLNQVWLNESVAAASPTTTGSGQTSRFQVDHAAGGTSNLGSTQTTTSTGSYTSSWSVTSTDWESNILEIKEIPTAGGTVVFVPQLLTTHVG